MLLERLKHDAASLFEMAQSAADDSTRLYLTQNWQTFEDAVQQWQKAKLRWTGSTTSTEGRTGGSQQGATQQVPESGSSCVEVSARPSPVVPTSGVTSGEILRDLQRKLEQMGARSPLHAKAPSTAAALGVLLCQPRAGVGNGDA